MPDRKVSRGVRLLRIVMPCIAVTCAVLFVPWIGLWAWLAPLPDTVQEQVEDAFGHGLDGIVVYAQTSSNPPTLYSAGWKNRDNQVPADPQALFKIASISKLYIAAASAKLIAGKRLSADDLLSDQIPAVVGRIENADKITLRMMLQHRSGIPNFVDQEGFDWSLNQADPKNNLSLAMDKPADFEPDTQYNYSNTNYLLIGQILDKLLGYSHKQYIENEIITPLGLTDTFGYLKQVDLKEVASGYHYQIGTDMQELDYTTPGGSMVATATDVGIFLKALNNGTLLSNDEQQVYSSIYDYEHTGWLPGYQSIARYYADTETVVIQFVSSTGGDSEMLSSIVYNRIVRILNKQ